MLKTYQGSCHCGRTRFEVDADLDHVRVCDCSICRRRGALLHRVEAHCLRVLTPIEDLATYSFNTHTAKDYFCKTCGILPFRQPRTRPGLWSVNFGACQTSIWVPSRSNTFTEAASRKFKLGHCRFQNRPLRSQTGRCRQELGKRWQLQNLS